MLKKRSYIIVMLLITCLLLFTGCSVRKNVRIKEVKEFTGSILESNQKIKSLDFYFVRPYLGSHLVYDGDLEKDELQYLVDEFKTLINIDFMQRIGDKYWGGARPSEFSLYVYIDTWGIQLTARKVTPTGMTLVSNQLGGEATGDYHTKVYYANFEIVK